MFRVIAGIASLSLALVAAPLAAQRFSIDEILTMNQLNLGDEAIIAKIESEDAVFVLSTNDMITLRQKGLSSAVIAAIVNTKKNAKQELSTNSPDPMEPHAAGLYYLTEAGQIQMVKMNYTVSSQAKTGGIIGAAFTGGIATASVKVSFQNEVAPVGVRERPTFYMFLGDDAAPAATGGWSSGANTSVMSPGELTLVELDKKQGRREARVGSFNIAGRKSGVMDQDRIPFRYNEVRPGVFKIQLDRALTPGEYGFIFSLGTGGTQGAMTARVFDFTVR